MAMRYRQHALRRKVSFTAHLPRRAPPKKGRRRGRAVEQTAKPESMHSKDSKREGRLAYLLLYTTFPNEEDPEDLADESTESPNARPINWFGAPRFELGSSRQGPRQRS